MTDKLIYISVLCFAQLLIIAILRYAMKNWIFSTEKKVRDALEAARVNPASLAQEFRDEIENGANIRDIIIRENKRFIHRNRFEMFVVGGGHILFLVLIICAFFVTDYSWFFLVGSVVLFLFFVVGRSGRAK